MTLPGSGGFPPCRSLGGASVRPRRSRTGPGSPRSPARALVADHAVDQAGCSRSFGTSTTLAPWRSAYAARSAASFFVGSQPQASTPTERSDRTWLGDRARPAVSSASASSRSCDRLVVDQLLLALAGPLGRHGAREHAGRVDVVQDHGASTAGGEGAGPRADRVVAVVLAGHGDDGLGTRCGGHGVLLWGVQPRSARVTFALHRGPPPFGPVDRTIVRIHDSSIAR